MTFPQRALTKPPRYACGGERSRCDQELDSSPLRALKIRGSNQESNRRNIRFAREQNATLHVLDSDHGLLDQIRAINHFFSYFLFTLDEMH